MFHCAPPEVNGFGVMTSTPSLTRSSQVWMSFGLPLRTAKTTTESVTMPLCVVVVPVGVDEALVDQRGHVGLEGEGDDVGGQAGLDGAALVAGGAVGLLEVDARAVRGGLEGRDDVLVRPRGGWSRRRA